jgi:hypothetical protein
LVMRVGLPSPHHAISRLCGSKRAAAISVN